MGGRKYVSERESRSKSETKNKANGYVSVEREQAEAVLGNFFCHSEATLCRRRQYR